MEYWIFAVGYLFLGSLLAFMVGRWAENKRPDHLVHQMGPLPWVMLVLLWPGLVGGILLRLAKSMIRKGNEL